MDGANIYGICVLACLVSPIFTDVSQQGVNPGNPKVIVGRTDGFPNNYGLNNPVLTQNQAIDERNNQVLLQNNANDDVSLMHNYRHNDKVSQETLTANGPGFAASLARSTAGNVPDVGLPYSTMNQQYVQTSQEDSRSAQADLEAEAMVLANMGLQSSRTGFYPISVGPYYSGGSSASAQAAAQAAAQSQLGLPYMTPGYPSSAYGSAVANANALAAGQANANAQALANSGLHLFSRVIPSSEYILPHTFPGGSDILYCSRLGELHYVWGDSFDCMICTCLSDFTVACARCGGCMVPPIPEPKPIPSPMPIPSPIPIPTPIPIPEPLPRPIPIPIPPPMPIPTPIPIPEPMPVPIPIPPPMPLPQPIPVPTPVIEVTCRPLPSNLPFENPINPCQICICHERFNLFGQSEIQIDCQENPECILPPQPITPTPVPIEPIPLPLCEKFPLDVSFPHPTEACFTCKCMLEPFALVPIKQFVCFPNQLCVPPAPLPQPIPRPPAPIPEPLPVPVPPGPLPGPRPHESCQPFSPNQPFQHPWDECQVCVCSESYSLNQVFIEVNCYTKKSCCIEIPRPIIQPLPFYPSGASSNAEASAISNAISGGGMFPYGAESYQGGSSASATAQAIADAGGVIGYPYNSVYPIQNGANAIAEAEANAIANAGKNLLQPTMYSKILQGRIVPGIAGSLAEAEASANANAVGYAPIAIGPQIYPGAGSNAYAQTEANAISNGGYMQVVPASQPVFYPTYGPAGTSAGASALVDANTYSSGVSSATANALANAYGGGLGYSNGYANAQVQALSLAKAQALAQAQSVAQAQALAKASANAQAAALSAIKSADPEDGDKNDRK